MKDTEDVENFLTIHVAGEPYRVRVSENDQKYIRDVETSLNNLVIQIKLQYPTASLTRVMGILSIRLAEELLELKNLDIPPDFFKLKSDIESLFQHTKSIS